MLLDDPQRFAPMRRLRRIIVGHDFEYGGEAALETALNLAGRWRAAVRLVHVVKPAARFKGWRSPRRAARQAMTQGVAAAGAQLDSIVSNRRFTRFAMEGEVRVGKTATELSLASWAWRADLLVIGRSAQVSRAFRPTTAERVARDAAVPILVSSAPLSQTWERIVVRQIFPWHPGLRRNRVSPSCKA
jgi:nucleotide-binding universal stress UspA family protein